MNCLDTEAYDVSVRHPLVVYRVYNCMYCAYMYVYVCGCVTVCVLVFIHCMHIVCECICYVGICIFHRTCKS